MSQHIYALRRMPVERATFSDTWVKVIWELDVASGAEYVTTPNVAHIILIMESQNDVVQYNMVGIINVCYHSNEHIAPRLKQTLYN